MKKTGWLLAGLCLLVVLAQEVAAEECRTFRLMSAQREAQFRRFLPRVDDRELQQLLCSNRLILYTDQEMPPCYQDWDGSLQGVHSIHYNVSANSSEPYGNANIEFPWGAPAGTHRSEDVTSFKFLYLPQDDCCRTWPVVWYPHHYEGDRSSGYAWIYPVGSIFGEVLIVTAPDGNGYTFEVRIRKREYGQWTVDVFRPFPKGDDLAARIKALRPQWYRSADLVRLVGQVGGEGKMPTATLKNQHPGRELFAQRMGLDNLPPVGDDRLVAELLSTTTFKSCRGETWRKDAEGTHTCAPTTSSTFHVIPAGYDAGFIEVDRLSCSRCHETVGRHARDFQPFRDWYGRVRGSDGIFSFHIFEEGGISYNGSSIPVRLNGRMISAGVLEKYAPKKHPAAIYQHIPELTP